MLKKTFVAVVVLGMCSVGTSALAFDPLPGSVLAAYPSATNLTDSCATCHVAFTSSGGALNPYGTAFLSADGLSDPAAAFAAIASADSDGDGTSNGDELSAGAGFLPGFTCQTYTSLSDAPANVADFVDPADVGCTGGGTTTTVPATTTTVLATTTTTTGGTTTTTVFGSQNCSQPVTTGPAPTASDCLFILRSAVGSSTCDPACICNVNNAEGITATDALICLKKAVGQSVELNCQCGGTTTTTVPATTTTVPATTTTTTGATTTTTIGGGSIVAGQALYDSSCSFCHAAGSHDPNAEVASDLAGKGDNVVANLGTIDPAMNGIPTLTEQQIADLKAFLNSL